MRRQVQKYNWTLTMLITARRGKRQSKVVNKPHHERRMSSHSSYALGASVCQPRAISISPPPENRIEYWLMNAFTCNLLEVKPLTNKLKPSVLLAIVLTSDFFWWQIDQVSRFLCVCVCVCWVGMHTGSQVYQIRVRTLHLAFLCVLGLTQLSQLELKHSYLQRQPQI